MFLPLSDPAPSGWRVPAAATPVEAPRLLAWNSALAEELAALKPDLAQSVVEGTTHFLPMERPDIVADALA